MVEGIEELVEADAHVVGGEGQPIMEEEVDVENKEDNPNISLHAITSLVTSKTMRIKGRLNIQELVILIDSGSTHNFVDPAMVRRAQIPINPRHKLTMTVANGEKATSKGGLFNLKVKLQNHRFNIDAYVLVLGGCDMILGVQWLKTLGMISWNFNDLSMQFFHDEQEVLLRGLVASQFLQDSAKLRLIKGEKGGLIMQLLVEDGSDGKNLNYNLNVADLLL